MLVDLFTLPSAFVSSTRSDFHTPPGVDDRSKHVTSGSNANAVIDVDGKLETLPAYALLLGYMHDWGDKFSSNLSYAYGWLETPESRDPLALKQGGILHVNLIYRPIKYFSCGIEYMYGGQQATNGAIGVANRLQTMVKFEY